MRRNITQGPRFNGASMPDSLSLIRSFNIETNPARPARPSPLTASTIPDMPLDLVDRIRSFPLFSSAPDTFLMAIGKHLRPQIHAAYDHILTEGDEAKAMYWLVRGAVSVKSRDGEATYDELKPGAFFGEIGILMNIPRTATIIARTKCLLLVLKEEDLRAELPKFPEMEKAIMEEAKERLTILNKKRMESGYFPKLISTLPSRGGKSLEFMSGNVSTDDEGITEKGLVINTKKRKSHSLQSIEDPAAGSALGSGFVNVRKTLKELPLFSNLPNETLHLLGLSAQPKTYPPFTNIIVQGSIGNEIYFIVRGEAEVIRESENKFVRNGSCISPRLKKGHYFGEVTSLALAPKRIATVRSITTVECLMIGGEVLENLWKCVSPEIRRQVETTAITRIKGSGDNILMTEFNDNSKEFSHLSESNPSMGEELPSESSFAPWKPPGIDPTKEKGSTDLIDPDPFLSLNMGNMKARSRRGSWAPPAPESISPDKRRTTRSRSETPIPNKFSYAVTPSIPTSPTTPTKSTYRSKRPKTSNSKESHGILPSGILIKIFSNLDIYQLMRMRQVSIYWSTLVTSSPLLCHTLDLSTFNRKLTNNVLINSILPFVGKRVRIVNISNCYHITDEGFTALYVHCGPNVKIWKMKSVWDISANAILEMANNSRNLEEIDLSNCRKVSDQLLARIVGWVIAGDIPALPPQSKSPKPTLLAQQGLPMQSLPIGIGCPKLKNLTLSYCKHVTDRFMAHLAAHAHSRLESINLTRCTTITDAGFQQWSIYRFENLRKLVLADCTYLTDNAIVYLCNSARGLRELDLSFCCALSDTATEVLSLGCPHLSILKLSFCGSAVSDSSLRSIGLHLLELKELSVRGCIRVTGIGVEAVVEGCSMLELFDVSQCKNLQQWLKSGGEEQSKKRWRSSGGGKPLFEIQKGGGAISGMVLR
ncbi:putative cyclic nucleotide-binding domain-containing protein [Erysiphe neolycopersici]|uniref:Putative cyclic nucleotide-binding domain-containing protein n=1 Tax=Erysiphe neolycopersici TaxID=212602 RepID=A0A420HRL1_9PEZI|nr:putative cyclic nucleotide-binding domain-containing protein [Erysiphe neolycopersici]